ncbi:MAG: hypothetical protein KGD64_12150, partial [Candidatus Heimdallarchaeota archaeon]|nr:hypothetical protein [Candidatus Heimdallarchaeota archaeon]
HASSLPVLQFALRRFSAHAGVHFAAAHRSPEKINIRIFDQTSIELPFSDIFSDEKIKKSKIVRSKPEKIADILSVKQANDLYRSALSSALGKDILKEKKFSVVLDCALGPMSEVFPNILAEIGCNVLTLNAFKPEGIPESLPSANSLSILSRTVVAAKADLGIAFDPSGSRAIFFDENGKIIDPQIISAILIQNKMIGRDTGKVVLSETMWPLENWLKSIKVSTIYAHDSPGEISRTIQFHRALFGANSQGNFIHPTISNESEPFASTLFLLSSFARDDKHKYISTFIEQWDILNKEDSEEKKYNLLSKADAFFEEIYEKDMENRIINTLYGLKIIFGERKCAHIFTTIISDIVSIRVCAEKAEDRAEMMKKTLHIVESVDRDIYENK